MRTRLAVLLVGILGVATVARAQVGPGQPQAGSILGNTSTICSVYQATAGTIQITGTWSGTINFESSTDGVTWNALTVTSTAGGTATSTTANGTWTFANSGYVINGVRFRGSSWASGAAATACTTQGVGTYFLGSTTARINLLGIATYNNIPTAGNGMLAPVAYQRQVGQTSVGTITTFTPAVDGSFVVMGNVNVTAAGSTLSMMLQVTYTDETNTPRTITLLLSQPASASTVTMTTAIGTVPYDSYPVHLRVKGGTTITIATTSTAGGATWNQEAFIFQAA